MTAEKQSDIQELFERTFSKQDIEYLVGQRKKPMTVKLYSDAEAKREIRILKFKLKCHKETIKQLRGQKKEVPKVITKYKTRIKEVPMFTKEVLVEFFATVSIAFAFVCVLFYGMGVILI